jgi:hypothetical protein
MQINAPSLIPSPVASASAPAAAVSPDPIATASAAPPTVTVALSDAATAAMAAAPSVSSNAESSGSLVAQVQQLAGVLADTSGASDADKASALANLYQLRFKSGGDGTDPSSDAWFTQSTPAQQQAVESQIEGSTYFKQAILAATRFNGAGIETARSGLPFDASKTEAARFGQLSPDQQTLVWAGGASQFGSLADFKAWLAKQAQGQAAMASDLKATAPPNTADASDDATGAAEAVKTLATTPTGTAADAALTLLRKAAAAQAAAKANGQAPPAKSQATPADASPSTASPTTPTPSAQPYEQGTIFSVAA